MLRSGSLLRKSPSRRTSIKWIFLSRKKIKLLQPPLLNLGYPSATPREFLPSLARLPLQVRTVFLWYCGIPNFC